MPRAEVGSPVPSEPGPLKSMPRIESCHPKSVNDQISQLQKPDAPVGVAAHGYVDNTEVLLDNDSNGSVFANVSLLDHIEWDNNSGVQQFGTVGEGSDIEGWGVYSGFGMPIPVYINTKARKISSVKTML